MMMSADITSGIPTKSGFNGILLAAAVAILVLCNEFGVRAALLVAAIGSLGLAYIGNKSPSRDLSGPSGSSSSNASQNEKVNMPPPQEMPFEVQHGQSLVLLPRDAVFSRALQRLATVLKAARPSFLSTSACILERFLQLHTRLASQTPVPGPGNTRLHERARQRMSSMAYLRNQVLQHLSTAVFETRSARAANMAKQATRAISNRSLALYNECVERWRHAIPSIGNGLPPHGMSGMPAYTDVNVLYPS